MTEQAKSSEKPINKFKGILADKEGRRWCEQHIKGFPAWSMPEKRAAAHLVGKITEHHETLAEALASYPQQERLNPTIAEALETHAASVHKHAEHALKSGLCDTKIQGVIQAHLQHCLKEKGIDPSQLTLSIDSFLSIGENMQRAHQNDRIALTIGRYLPASSYTGRG